MSLENAVQAILEKGKAEASRVIEEAHSERKRTLSEIRAEATKTVSDAEARARQEAERRRIQELARAELESRKIVLVAQKESLDQVYSGALARLGKLPENESFLRTLLDANEAEWRSGGKVYCNARDEAAVRRIVGTAFAGTIDCAGGLVIESADESRRVDLRYESILRDIWVDSVREVAEILWPPRASKA
ncbi:MAG TPA: V-type ATP synthase subunit E family protein [Thermoplasmata archaeon]|jgi:V/A-type H+-transporting ATPase subunit E